MKTRYFTVGAAIENLTGNIFIGIRPKTISPEDLERLSFYKLDILRLFTSYDEAKEYAYGLREKNQDYSYYPRTALSHSKVRPIFTLELSADVTLGQPCTEQFQYIDEHLHGERVAKTTNKEITLHFYEVESREIKSTDIIRAEFYNANMSPVEFDHTPPSQNCVLC